MLNAVSVGFRPIRWTPNKDGEGHTYDAWELMELSCVAVRCDPGAVMIARSHRRDAGGSSAESPDIVHIQAIANSLAKALKCINSAYGAHARTKNHLQQMDAYLLEGQRHAEALKRAGGLAPATSDDDELDPASDDEGDLELSMTPQQRQARLGRLDRIGVDGGNLPAVRAPEAGGGAFLSARVLEDELERLKRFWR